MREFRRHSETSVDYTGSDTLYPSYANLDFYNQQFHRLSVDQRIRWKRGELSVKDLFSYFGNRGFGTSSPGGIGVPPNEAGIDFFGANVFGPSYLGNVTVASISEDLTKRSSANFSGSYSLTDYLANSEGLFNSRQVSMQAGYTYRISRRNDIGVVYGYQDFEFTPSFESLVTNSGQLVFQHHVSDRMDLVLGAGPERIVTSGVVAKTEINATAQAAFRYRWKKSSVSLSYDRMVTSGSGFYAGGISNTAQLSIERRFTRSWEVLLNGGYITLSGLGASTFGTQLYQSTYWLTGATLRRSLGRSLTAFVDYQFNYDSFGTCRVSGGCNPGVRRNAVLIGFDWSLHPVRLE